MQIELSEREVRQLTQILTAVYDKSVDVREMSFIKEMLKKLGHTIDDWIPDFADL